MILRSSFAFLFFVLFAFSSNAGTRPDLDDFEKDVVIGMEKTEVIAALGSPRISKRWNGKDRWIYFFYQKEGKVVKTIRKELHFREGIVVYKGDKLRPKGLSADEQDKANLEQVIADNANYERNQEEAKKAREEYNRWNNKEDTDTSAIVPQFKDVD